MRVPKRGKVRSKGNRMYLVSFCPEGIGMLRPRRMTHTQNIDTPLVSDIVISFMFHPDHMYCYSLNVKGLGFSNPPTFSGFVLFVFFHNHESFQLCNFKFSHHWSESHWKLDYGKYVIIGQDNSHLSQIQITQEWDKTKPKVNISLIMQQVIWTVWHADHTCCKHV